MQLSWFQLLSIGKQRVFEWEITAVLLLVMLIKDSLLPRGIDQDNSMEANDKNTIFVIVKNIMTEVVRVALSRSVSSASMNGA